MSLLDWLIVIVPIILIVWMAIYSSKYARGVVDYLAAGRIAGRYVLSVGDMAAGMTVIYLVAGTEARYQTGFVVGFWGAITAPVGLFIALTGYCTYRWRQTRCLSFGQFIELRYGSKFFRIFCAALRTIAEMVTNAIGPAIATNFFIYYLGLPHKIMICGVSLPCYAIIVVLCLILAIILIWPGGRISLLITDSIQGIISYPIFVVIVGYIILNFSWSQDVAPVMWNRVEGQSFMNPYDISRIRDFNLFALVVSLCGSVLNRAGWIGNDTTGAGKTPHEQKMAGVLGGWRNGFSGFMTLLLAVITIVFMTSPHFFKKNRFNVTSAEIRQELSQRVLEEVVSNPEKREQIMREIDGIPAKVEAANAEYVKNVASSPEAMAALRCKSAPGKYVAPLRKAVADVRAGKTAEPEFADTLIQKPVSQTENPDSPYLQAVRNGLGDTPQGRHEFQKFRSLYNQMMMPTLVRRIFPVGMLGLFCLLMVMLLVSTDDSRIFNASSCLFQDVILPFFKKRLPPEKHLLYLRLMTVGVGFFFLMVSLLFSNMDYINMFTTIMCALWLGGAGPIMVFGLYSRWGNLTGAWCAIIFGSGHSLFGLLMQRNWALTVYPFLEQMGWVEGLNNFLVAVSAPFNPWISWSMNPVKYPVNSYEIYFISMMLSLIGYIGGSLLTYKPYDLDKLLHRGEYAVGPEPVREKWTIRNILSKLIGITPEYTRGDRFIAYFVFSYSIVYGILIAFLAIVIWNVFSPWPDHWWTVKFFITMLLIPGIAGIISTVWFLIGGIHDLRQLFIDLKKRVEDANDNGQILDGEKH
ncbi:MAG: sodium:panthothenate symporter [Lentisphaeria bacterium]|nr:sodium:panthothenate symporter [Lentisphaeria bacterium]